MSQIFDRDIVEDIRTRINIGEVISEYIPLKQYGSNNLKGLCPFHQEKTPSFNVNISKQIFYCFGCGTGGDIFSFLMQYHSISFPEALEMLAKKAGVILPEKKMSPALFIQANKRKRLFALNYDAMIYFQGQLKKSGKQKGLEYLKKRGLCSEIIDKFFIGYAPDGWENLIIYLKKKGYTTAEISDAGLIVQRNNGGYYDRFRGRIIFPILDRDNRVTGFGGRSLDGQEPKYLNSPQTTVFNKSRQLYGFPQASSVFHKAKKAIIAEGYFDLIALNIAGFDYAVATLGTALTKAHLPLLRGRIETLVILFDGDEAGIKAAFKTAPILINESFESRVAVLPKGHDPDTFLSSEGAHALENIMDNAPLIFDFCLENLISKNSRSMEGKLKSIEELKPLLTYVSDPVRKDTFLQKAGFRLGIQYHILKESIRSSGNRNENIKIDTGIGSCLTREEEYIARMMLIEPGTIRTYIEAGLIDKVSSTGYGKIIHWIIDNYSDDKGFSFLPCIEALQDDNLKACVSRLIIEENLLPLKYRQVILSDTLNYLKKKDKREPLEKLQIAIEEAEAQDDISVLMKLLLKKQSLQKENIM